MWRPAGLNSWASFVYINDLLNVSSLTQSLLFADDTSVFCSHKDANHLVSIAQGEIRCFRNSEMLRKPDGSNFRCVSAGRLRRETCKMKMEVLFRVSAALPLT